MGVKKTKRKWIILIAVIAVAVVVTSLFIVIPFAFSERFVSISFEPYFYVGPGHPTLEVIYFNGSIIPITIMGVKINITNSYFLPVQIMYNGFDYVMLIYNHTVADPADVAKNKDHLVWGAFDACHPVPWSWSSTRRLSDSESYNYYVSRKDLLNYTRVIKKSFTTIKFEGGIIDGPCWTGQNLNGRPVSVGTYYIYCIAYGKVAGPFNLTVTSVLWK